MYANLNHMWPHFASLARRVVANFLSALGTSRLGFLLVVASAILAIAVTVGLVLRRHGRQAMRVHLKTEAKTALTVFLIVTLILYVPVFVYEIVRTVFDDHQALAHRNQVLAAANRQLNGELHWRIHNISTNDPVFPNLIYLLRAFAGFRYSMRGQPCAIWITAPPKSLELARVVAQFSSTVSGCATFGPNEAGNPDLDEATSAGAVPDAILIHATRNDSAADVLVSQLGNQIKTARTYKLPPPTEMAKWIAPSPFSRHLIWLQFGPNAMWNSEAYPRGSVMHH